MLITEYRKNCYKKANLIQRTKFYIKKHKEWIVASLQMLAIAVTFYFFFVLAGCWV